MNIFKVGDKVEFTTDYPERAYQRVYKGDTATVTESTSRDDLVTVKLDKDGNDAHVFSRRLKLVQPKYDHNGLKVGDKVRYTPSLWEGMEGTVHAFHKGYVEVMVTKLPDNPNQYSEVVVGKTLNQTVGGLGVSPYSLKKIETGFAEGDKVRYESNGENHEFDGLELTVGKSFGGKGHWVTVTKGNHDSRWTVGKRLTLTAKFLQPIVEQEYKVGDKVKFIGKVIGFEGEIVTLTEVDRPGSGYKFRVQRADGESCPIGRHEFEVIPQEVPFTYKSIQKGDKIKRTMTRKSGAVETREGIVDKFGSYYVGEGSYILAYEEDDDAEYVTLELVERPEPVKVEPKPEDVLVDNAKVGDQIIATLDRGVRKLYTKDAENNWATIVIKADSVHKGFDWSDSRMKANLRDRDAKLVKH